MMVVDSIENCVLVTAAICRDVSARNSVVLNALNAVALSPDSCGAVSPLTLAVDKP